MTTLTEIKAQHAAMVEALNRQRFISDYEAQGLKNTTWLITHLEKAIEMAEYYSEYRVTIDNASQLPLEIGDPEKASKFLDGLNER